MSKIILGGGLSGLSAAYYLGKRLPKQAVTVIESSSRTGGWIKSNVQENGTVFEQGPRTIRPRGEAGANTLQLIEELKLSDQIIPIDSNHPAAKNRMIYAKSSLHMLPSSFLECFKKKEPFSKPLMFHLLHDLKAAKKQVHDESIYDFIERRFGDEVADYLISPLVCGICAGNAQEVSVKFLMKKIFDLEQQYGSIIGGACRSYSFKKKETAKLSGLALKAKKEKWNIYSFMNGCESLPLALRDNIVNNGTDIKLQTKCKSVTLNKNQVTLHLDNNDTISTQHLISAVPAPILGTLLKHQHPVLAESLQKLVKNVSVGVVNLHFKDNLLNNKAFGLLVAPKEKLPILGIIFDSCCFPKTTSETTLTVMMGGYWFKQHFGENPSEETLFNVALTQVKHILNIHHNPDNYKVNILRNCLPQYVIGHDDHLDAINSYIENNSLPVSLCGASYHGVGINDVILSAKNAVNKID